MVWEIFQQNFQTVKYKVRSTEKQPGTEGGELGEAKRAEKGIIFMQNSKLFWFTEA